MMGYVWLIILFHPAVSTLCQEMSVAELEPNYHIQLIQAGTEDSGYGAQRRYRGWNFSLTAAFALLL